MVIWLGDGKHGIVFPTLKFEIEMRLCRKMKAVPNVVQEPAVFSSAPFGCVGRASGGSRMKKVTYAMPWGYQGISWGYHGDVGVDIDKI